MVAGDSQSSKIRKVKEELFVQVVEIQIEEGGCCG